MTNATTTTETETTTYEIIEEGHVFARIEASSAEDALTEAASAYPRRAKDYNLDPGETSTVRWHVWEDGVRVSAELPVPGEGTEGMTWG